MNRDTLLPLCAMIVPGLLAVGGIGSCVADYAYSTRQFRPVVVTDRRHVPGHYVTVCTTDYIEAGEISLPITTCEEEWVPPRWTVRYSEEPVGGGRELDVSQELHDQLAIGRRVHVAFSEGRYYGFRYGEAFIVTLPTVE